LTDDSARVNSSSDPPGKSGTSKFLIGELRESHLSQQEGEGDDDDPTFAELLGRIRSYIAPGAVFRLAERDIGRYLKPGRRPIMVVGPVPDLRGNARIALTRQVRVSTRRSWKPELFDLPEDEDAEYRLFEKNRVVFTRAGLLKAFTKPGFFEIDVRVVIPVRVLEPEHFLGWLPQPYVSLITSAMKGQRVPVPYPPREP
jgi:hypothetical protein